MGSVGSPFHAYATMRSVYTKKRFENNVRIKRLLRTFKVALQHRACFASELTKVLMCHVYSIADSTDTLGIVTVVKRPRMESILHAR